MEDNNKLPVAETMHQKVQRGLLRAQEQLFRERAARGETLVVSRNGQITEVPAAQLLAQLEQQKQQNNWQW